MARCGIEGEQVMRRTAKPGDDPHLNLPCAGAQPSAAARNSRFRQPLRTSYHTPILLRSDFGSAVPAGPSTQILRKAMGIEVANAMAGVAKLPEC